MRSRTLLARKPKLAIFDEPEAGIDLWSFAMLVDTFDKLRRTGDQTVIIISHQERILQLADDIMVLQDGGIRGVRAAGGGLPDAGEHQYVLRSARLYERLREVCDL